MYNRASADPEGKPWSEKKKWVWWDAEAKKWVGYDVPDYIAAKPPNDKAKPGAAGMDAIARHGAVYYASRRARLALRTWRARGRPATDTLRSG